MCVELWRACVSFRVTLHYISCISRRIAFGLDVRWIQGRSMRLIDVILMGSRGD